MLLVPSRDDTGIREHCATRSDTSDWVQSRLFGPRYSPSRRSVAAAVSETPGAVA